MPSNPLRARRAEPRLRSNLLHARHEGTPVTHRTITMAALGALALANGMPLRDRACRSGSATPAPAAPTASSRRHRAA